MRRDPKLHVHNQKRRYVLTHICGWLHIFLAAVQTLAFLPLTWGKDRLRWWRSRGSLSWPWQMAIPWSTWTFNEPDLRWKDPWDFGNAEQSLSHGPSRHFEESDWLRASFSQNTQTYRRVAGQLSCVQSKKECSKGLAGPTDHFSKLKHLAKYFSGTNTFVQLLRPNENIPPQHEGIDINCYVDSDWAGDPDSCKSTSGVSLFVLGNITAHSRTQQPVALSSGQAELHWWWCSYSLHVHGLVTESSWKANICVLTGSTAGKSTAGRFGTSRTTKHVELRYSYVQERVQSGLIRLRRVLGTLNLADILTKYAGKDTLSRRLGTFGLIPK